MSAAAASPFALDNAAAYAAWRESKLATAPRSINELLVEIADPRWHTDGYYNPPQRTVRGMILHCVESAASGGDSQLLEHDSIWPHIM